MRALQVDAELSPLVRRSFSLISSTGITTSSSGSSVPSSPSSPVDGISPTNHHDHNEPPDAADSAEDEAVKTVLRTEYKAKTNRMLRVAVNGFMESLGVVLGVMERLDVDVLAKRA